MAHIGKEYGWGKAFNRFSTSFNSNTILGIVTSKVRQGLFVNSTMEHCTADGCLMINSQSSRKQTMNRGSQALEIPKGKRNLKQITLRHHMKLHVTSFTQVSRTISAFGDFQIRFRHFGSVLYRDPRIVDE